MRAWLVGVSLVLHIAVIFGLFVAGMWRIDQLDPAKHHIDIAVALPPPAAAAGSPNLKSQPFTPKHHIVHEIVLPEHVTVATTDTPSEVVGTGTGSGTGSGSDGDGDGECTENCGPGSAAAPVVAVVPPLVPAMIAPTVLRGLRISGDTQVQPNNAIRVQLFNEGRGELTAMFKICIDTRGGVSSIAQLRSTGFPAYDDRLAGAIRTWRYRPYSVNNAPIPVCGVVTFNYSMK